MALTLTQAQRLLLGIIASVEAGVTEPEDAVIELNELKDKAVAASLQFQADYSLEDFVKLREEELSRYDSDFGEDDFVFDAEEEE